MSALLRRLRVGHWLPPALLIAVLLLAWELGVRIFETPAYILPPPSQIVTAFGEVRGLLAGHTVTTLTEALVGIVAGAVAGVALAVAVWAVPMFRRLAYPLLVASQTVPMIVLAPLLVLWFGFGLTPKVVVVALIAVFPVAISTVQGLASADREQIDLLRSMGADRRDILRLVLVPGATPAFFAGLRIASAYAIAGAVIGEWVGASSGLGLFLTRSQTSFRVDRVFVGVAVITALSVALFGIVDLLSRVAAPWQRVERDQRTRMNRKAIVAAVLTVLLAACGGQSAEPGSSSGDQGSAAPSAAPEGTGGEVREVTVMLDWTPNTNHSGLYLALDDGWYADAGLDVRIIQPGAQGGLPALASGDADFAVSVQEAVTPARAQGAPVVSVAAIIASNTSSLIALAGEGIGRPADLAGHRYGGFGGELETELVRTLVECDGGDPDAVEFVEVGNVDYRAGLERDFYDFVWIFDGWDGIRLEQVGLDITSIRFADHFDCIPNWYTPLLATSQQLIDGDPQLVSDFMAATARGYERAIEAPDEAADALLAAAPELDEELVRESARYLADEYAPEGPWGVQEAAVWDEFTAFLQEAAIAADDIDVDAAWTNEFLPAGDGAAGSEHPTDGG